MNALTIDRRDQLKRELVRTSIVLMLVAGERQQQRHLFKEKKIPFECSDKTVGAWRKLPVLMEEAGEVAKELNEYENGNRTKEELKMKLRAELLQTAAVCVAWVESLED